MKNLLIAFLMIVISFSGGKCFGQTAKLKVVVSNISEKKGSVMIGVFDNALDFKSKKNPYASAKAKANDSTISYTFPELIMQRYAIAVYHDENNDGELNIKKLGIPTEGVGFSSKVASKLHQPIFPEASFMLKSDTTIYIRMYYTNSK